MYFDRAKTSICLIGLMAVTLAAHIGKAQVVEMGEETMERIEIVVETPLEKKTEETANEARLIETNLIDDVYVRQMELAPMDRADLEFIRDVQRVPSEISKNMSAASFAKFLRNRRLILTMTYWLLRPISFSRAKLADRMTAIDEFVAKSSNAIAQSNRTGFVLSLSLSAGLGLSDKLISRIESKAIKTRIPKSGGFYYVLACGIGFFVRQTTPIRKHFVVDLFADIDVLEKIHTYAGEVSVAVNWGIAADTSKSPSRETFKSHYIGILGVVRESVEHFSYSLITGLALPPYLPVGMVYSNGTTRARATVLAIPLPSFMSRDERCERMFTSADH